MSEGTPAGAGAPADQRGEGCAEIAAEDDEIGRRDFAARVSATVRRIGEAMAMAGLRRAPAPAAHVASRVDRREIETPGRLQSVEQLDLIGRGDHRHDDDAQARGAHRVACGSSRRAGSAGRPRNIHAIAIQASTT